MWQTSDKVPRRVIEVCTETCERSDCRLSARIGETTLVSSADYYDKNGVLHVHNDNTKNVRVDCGKCWRRWTVKDYPLRSGTQAEEIANESGI